MGHTFIRMSPPSILGSYVSTIKQKDVADKLPVPHNNLMARSTFYEPANLQMLGLTITSNTGCNDTNQLHFRLHSELTCLYDLHISLHCTFLYIAILYTSLPVAAVTSALGLFTPARRDLLLQIDTSVCEGKPPLSKCLTI